MKKRLATILRSWADWLYPEPKQMPIKIDLCEYEPKRLTLAKTIDNGEMYAKFLELRRMKLDNRREPLVSACIEEAKEWISSGIIKGIKEKNLIEFDIDRENMTVRGKLKIWTK